MLLVRIKRLPRILHEELRPRTRDDVLIGSKFIPRERIQHDTGDKKARTVYPFQRLRKARNHHAVMEIARHNVEAIRV